MAALSGQLLIFIAVILALIGSIVALGGVGKLTDLCDDYGTHKACSEGYSYEWWGIFFSFFLAIVIAVMSVMGKTAAWTSTLQAFCAACLSVVMIDAHRYIGSSLDAAEAALAGFIILGFAWFLMIIFLGMGSAGINVSVAVASNKTAPVDDKKTSKTPVEDV